MKLFISIWIFITSISAYFAPDNSKDYESYVMALTWGGTICKFNQCLHYGRDDVFNIHGLWPNHSKEHVQYCSRVSFFENEIDRDIKNILYQYWNSFYSDNWKFIFHEVKKHGSCWDFKQGNLNRMPRQIKQILRNYRPRNQDSILNTYLEISIALSQIINPYVTLLENGIVPGNEYFMGEIMNTLSDNYGWDTVIPVCKEDRRYRKMYINELRFCLDLNFKYTKCNSQKVQNGIRKCKKYNEVQYPLFPTDIMEDQLIKIFMILFIILQQMQL